MSEGSFGAENDANFHKPDTAEPQPEKHRYSRFQIEALSQRPPESKGENLELDESKRNALLAYFTPRMESQERINDSLDPTDKATAERHRTSSSMKRLLGRGRILVEKAATGQSKVEEAVRSQVLLESLRAIDKDIKEGRVDIVKKILREDYLEACREYWRDRKLPSYGDTPVGEELREMAKKDRDEAIRRMASIASLLHSIGGELPSDDDAIRIILKRDSYVRDDNPPLPDPAFKNSRIWDDMINDMSPSAHFNLSFSDKVKEYNEKGQNPDSSS